MTRDTMSIGDKLVYNVEEASELLSVGRTTVFQLIAEGRIGSLKIGHRRLIPRQDLEAFITALRTPASKSQ